MGMQDQPLKKQVEGVPQQMVVVVKDAADDEIEKLSQLLLDAHVPQERFHFQWNTWKGIFLTPPPDEVPWTQQEWDQISNTLKEHPNVMDVDWSDGDGSQG